MPRKPTKRKITRNAIERSMANPYELEDGIEIPEQVGRRTCYPWDNMEVGQSFLVDDKPRNNVYQLVKYQNNKPYTRREYTARDMHGGVRIWRTK